MGSLLYIITGRQLNELVFLLKQNDRFEKVEQIKKKQKTKIYGSAESGMKLLNRMYV